LSRRAYQSEINLWIVASFIFFASLTENTGYTKPLELLAEIPEPFISLESQKNTMILVEKSTQQLYLYEFDGNYRQILRIHCSTGKVAGNKREAGDRKTPEGIYFCTEEFTKKELAPIYGTRAFPIDYPNYIDRTAGRNGSAIWIHGTNKELKRRDSNGCIALNNEDIDLLSQYILLNRTPVILVNKMKYSHPEEIAEVKEAVAGFLDNWSLSFNAASIADHLAYYDDSFSFDVTFWTDWVPVRDRLTALTGQFTVGMKNLSVYRHDGVFVALFDQIAQTSEQAWLAGTRKLFLTRQGDRFKIIGDEFQTLPNKGHEEGALQTHPLIAASTSLEKNLLIKEEIKSMIDEWLAAWISKDVERYGQYYSEGFRAMDMDRAGWLNYKRVLNRKYGFINVSIDNLSVSTDKNNQSTVTFVQTYQSSGLCDIGSKKLLLKREGGKWKILREIWKEK